MLPRYKYSRRKEKGKKIYLSELECKEKKVIKGKSNTCKVLHKTSFTKEHQKNVEQRWEDVKIRKSKIEIERKILQYIIK